MGYVRMMESNAAFVSNKLLVQVINLALVVTTCRGDVYICILSIMNKINSGTKVVWLIKNA